MPETPLRWLAAALLLGSLTVARGAEIDLGRAVVVAAKHRPIQEQKAVDLLVEEVQKRTRIRWEAAEKLPAGSRPTIILGHAGSPPNIDLAIPLPREKGADGFEILVKPGPPPLVYVIGNDARGMLFGVGRLLRELRMSRDQVSIADSLNIATAPKYQLRGHQLGYRPKTNSYDGWSLPMWEQYIRDLVVFGTNAIELIPPRSDDDSDSPHFPLPPMQMMIGMSKLCADYGLDVWIWYPAMDLDYSNPRTVELALKELGEVFRQLPKVDAVFVPGGDPGHTRPSALMALLEKQTANLHRYHPKAQMWVSPQSFSREWFDEFLGILKKDQPAWLSGVVHGPQVRVDVAELRKLVPQRYPIRRYPDITHSLRCEYPVPDWDVAYALTEAREVINPRPLDQARIFHAYEKDALGFICYSEGCNDDVNKIVWSSLGWDPNASVDDVLLQYSRYFIGERPAAPFAGCLKALEGNWRNRVKLEVAVNATLVQIQQLDKNATPQMRLNWRFQQLLYRGYYDAYLGRRQQYETTLEEEALRALRVAGQLGSLVAMKKAEENLELAVTRPVAPALRARVFELAEALFQSIRMQLSVERYKAIAVGRGANLDTIDVPLNNRVWLKRQFAELRKLESEEERLQGIDAIVNWTNPGPGGFYDDLGDPSRRPHLVGGEAYDKDPAYYRSPLTGFAFNNGWRISWCRHAETLFETPLNLRYSGLDKSATYRIRVVYAGDNFRTRVKLTANDSIEVHPLIAKTVPVKPQEFEIPPEATRGGELKLSWSAESGRGGNGRVCQVSEVWLIKK
jgi:hypothetical protein